MKPRAYILSKWETGLGDGYSNLITSYNAMKELESLGYDTVFVKDIVKNIYYDISYPITHIFNFDPFEDKIIFENRENYFKEYIHLPQNNNTIDICVTDLIPGINTYQYKILNTPTFVYASKEHEYRYRDIQFLSHDVLKFLNNCIVDKGNDIGGLCIRVRDEHLTSTLDRVLADPLHKDITTKALDFYKKCKQKSIFVTSSNKAVERYVTSLDSRAFNFTYTWDFEMHNPYSINNAKDYRYIKHAQEIAVSMALFSRCKELRQIVGNPSSFMAYGIAHNKNYPNITDTVHSCLI